MHIRCPLSRHVILLATLVFLATTLTGCIGAGGTADPYSKRYTASDINPKPAILNNAIVKGTNLTGLRLENVVVKDATFFNTTSQNAFFKNVVFDNCRFINAKFDRAVLENVVFRGGILTCENDVNNISSRTAFTNSEFKNLILDGTFLENTIFNGSNGSIAVRNVKNILALSPIITGKNMRLSMQNSIFQHMVIADVTGTSSLTAVGCTFYNASFGKSTFSDIVFSKNITYGPPVYVDRRTSQRRKR